MPTKRSPRSIRFSEDEWSGIVESAERLGIPTGEFVRKAAVAVAGAEPAPKEPRLTPELIELIEHTFRYAYFSATVKRDEMQRDGRGDVVDEAVELARKAQDLVLSGTAESHPADENP